MSEGKRDTFQDFQHNTECFGEIIQPIRSTSVTAAEGFRETINLLFIDGNHEYDEIKADWTQWSRHLAADATVVFHDIGWAEGVQQVVADDVKPQVKTEKRMPNLYWATLRSNSSEHSVS